MFRVKLSSLKDSPHTFLVESHTSSLAVTIPSQNLWGHQIARIYSLPHYCNCQLPNWMKKYFVSEKIHCLVLVTVLFQDPAQRVHTACIPEKTLDYH